jgi:ABC-type amino acid transport substrate-binding protein
MRTFFKLVILPAFIALIVALAVTHQDSTGSQTARKTAYDRVMDTGTLRCGYALWPGLLERDPNTQQFSGIMYDYLAALGKAAELKVEWAEEISYGDMPEALRTGRIDAYCGGAWTNAVRGKYADATTPITYQTINAYTRADNMTLDGDAGKINAPGVTIATIDGESAATIAAIDFPKAKTFSLPKSTDIAQILLNVADSKADVAFVDPESAQQFMANNPGKLRKINSAFPIRVYGVPLWFGKGEQNLIASLNNATQELLNTGAIERILKKYETVPGSYLRAKTLYEVAPIP